MEKLQLLPARKAAKALGLPEHTIRTWIANGFISTISCGKKQLINVTKLREKLEAV